jgi:hypothetical protein
MRVLAITPIVSLPGQAATVVVVPRAPIVHATPHPGLHMRPHGSPATKPSFFWWMWSSPQPCKKGKNGKCRG